MEKFYGEVFSRLEKHIKTIEKKQGAWMFTLIISGVISTFIYVVDEDKPSEFVEGFS